MGCYYCNTNWKLSTSIRLEHLSEIRDNRIHHIISNSIVNVGLGELFQFQDQFNSEQSITNYLRRINRKHFINSLATEVGAITSEANDETIRKLKMIGHYIGMSFQIVDDILDFTSTEKKLGKPVGSDLMNGHITLPVLLEMKKIRHLRKNCALNHQSESQEFKPLIEQIRNFIVLKNQKQLVINI